MAFDAVGYARDDENDEAEWVGEDPEDENVIWRGVCWVGSVYMIDRTAI